MVPALLQTCVMGSWFIHGFREIEERLYEDAAQDNIVVQQEGVPITSHRTEELMQVHGSCPQGPTKNCNL